MDKQTIFKNGDQYHDIHKDILLKKGYTITEETKEYTVFEKKDLPEEKKL